MGDALDDADGIAGDIMGSMTLVELKRYLDGKMSDEELDKVLERIEKENQI